MMVGGGIVSSKLRHEAIGRTLGQQVSAATRP